jgi:hypothetical protein
MWRLSPTDKQQRGDYNRKNVIWFRTLIQRVTVLLSSGAERRY